MSIKELQLISELGCKCGKEHKNPIDEIFVGKGVINELPRVIKKYNATKVFVVSDINTQKAAGDKVCEILKSNDIDYVSYVIPENEPHPDEHSVGSVIMHYNSDCDIIVGVGSGVVNDISKILTAVSGNPYIIVGTAPSMDGYASSTSSMTRDGLKISLKSTNANVIIGDTDILCKAPEKLLLSGLGDMLAKYVSICEWRIANVITGEYYCEEIANLVRTALKRCTDNAYGLLKRDEEAVKAVFEGLVICGVAMTFAGVSRPASGVEHYISHVLDMRGAEFGKDVELHGIQCAVGTLYAVKLYEKIKAVTPNVNKAKAYAMAFDKDNWNSTLREFLGKSAESMIKLEEKEGKYDIGGHSKRIDTIIANWDKILKIVDEELPKLDDLETLMNNLGMPKTFEDIGVSENLFPLTFKCTKDIRDKYVLSRLAWDLGIIDEMV